MKRKPRIYYSDAQKALMWDCWQQSESMHDIVRPQFAGVNRGIVISPVPSATFHHQFKVGDETD